MSIMKPIWILFFFFLPLCGFSLTIQLIDRDSEQIEEIIVAILEIQKSLLLPLETSEMPPYVQTGFLTIRMTPQDLMDFLQGGRFLIAFQKDQIVGYLLLNQIDQYLKWAHGNQFKSDWDLNSLYKVQYIDQLAVASNFARQGIGTELIKYAKALSPYGLLTDILAAPYANQASMHFFTAQGFLELGIMSVEETILYPRHATSVMLWLPD